MPKGGDLHHHFSGSIYAEPIEDAIAEDFYLNTTWKSLRRNLQQETGRNSLINKRGELGAYKQKIMKNGR
jgi:adenosine deaminase/adenosine deaminase CECR1